LKKSLLTALLTAGVVTLGVGMGIPPRTAANPGTNPPEIAPPAKGNPPGAKPTPETTTPCTIAGRVFDGQDKPVAGAELAVWTDQTRKKEDISSRATSMGDGSFRLTVARAELDRNARLVATAAGHGPDWVVLPNTDQLGDLTLHLAADDLPIDGRVLSLEGRPLAGIAVWNVMVGKRAEGGGLGPWGGMWENRVHPAKSSQHDHGADVPLIGMRPEALGVPLSTTTDKDGAFRLTGFGRERMVSLDVRGPGIERRTLTILTRTDVGSDLAGLGIHPATF